MSNKNILTPVDFSVNSIQAFDFAVQYSRQHKTILHLLHVIDPSLFEQSYRFNNEFMMMERMRSANEELKKFVNEIPHPELEIIENLRIGKPYKEILNYSQQHKIDLIIIGSHGWTAEYNLVTGSVAAKVIELSKVPVICLKTDASILKNHDIIIDTTMAENWIG
ncbi:MAG: universal stress protein [Ignavibacteria bacterium]|nr:universal stress protein [Ignavibacteria bacterium]